LEIDREKSFYQRLKNIQMNKRVGRFVALPLLAALILSSPQDLRADEVESSCADELAHGVQQHYRDVDQLEATFRQTTETVSIGARRLSRSNKALEGKMFLQKPSKMRWEYQTPEPSLIVSDGDVMWLYDPAQKEVQHMSVEGGLMSMAGVQFLIGQGEILTDFTASTQSCEPVGDRVVLQLVPRQERTYEKLELVVQVSDHSIVETSVFDLFGNITRVALKDVKTDGSFDSDIFIFEVPADVRILELAQPTP
jgi:outer membrane lipoprotein carrier protein